MKFRHKQHIHVLGEEYQLQFQSVRTLKPLVLQKAFALEVYRSELKTDVTHSEILTKWLKEAARKYISNKAIEYAELIGVEFNRIAIKDTRSRWGSCSSKKNLNFSWRLILMPKDIMDYVIAHEVAHLAQMNHSKRFWAVVERIDAAYKEKRVWLRKHGAKVF